MKEISKVNAGCCDESVLKAWVSRLGSADSAHDIAHIERVVKNAQRYARAEKANIELVTTAAWLHDCVSLPKDSPHRAKASQLAAEKAGKFLQEIGKDDHFIIAVQHAIAAHSYSANILANSVEAKIVQDADRIDALGAVGMARCFMVGGALERRLYDSTDPFCQQREPDDTTFCIDHFFIKLFNIAESLHTQAAKVDAKERVLFMKNFLHQLGVELDHVYE